MLIDSDVNIDDLFGDIEKNVKSDFE